MKYKYDRGSSESYHINLNIYTGMFRVKDPGKDRRNMEVTRGNESMHGKRYKYHIFLQRTYSI
jgi:hypothetical protein